MPYSLKEKENKCFSYVRKQVMSVVQNVNRTIRIKQKKRNYAISNIDFSHLASNWIISRLIFKKPNRTIMSYMSGLCLCYRLFENSIQ